MPKVNPRVDFVFKKLFGVEENKDLLIDLINSIVDEKDRVIDIQIRNPYNDKNFRDDKLSILDIKAQDALTNTWFNIEMQISKQEDYDKRALYYWSRVYVAQLSAGVNYDLLTKTIAINFLNFNKVPEENYHNVYKIFNRATGKEFIDQLEIHFIELEKYDGHREAKTLLDKWTYFLKEAGEFDRAPAELENVETIKKALEILENISMTSDEREAYEARLKWLRDSESALKTAKKEGWEEGREEGRQEGRQVGREEGLQEGLQEGQKKAAISIATSLLGVLSDDMIAQNTGLSLEEVKSLHKK